MTKGFFVTATDTEVGKTTVAAALAAVLAERGLKVGVMKPVATGGVFEDGRLVSRDAQILSAAIADRFPLELVNPVCLKEPLAPTVAAEIEGVCIDLEAIRRAFGEISASSDAVVVEGIGGLAVPVAEGFDVADLACEFNLPLLVVGRLSLGTINHTLLTLRYAQERGLRVAGIMLNRCQQGPDGLAEQTNPREIERTSGHVVLGTLPFVKGLRLPENLDRLAATFKAGVNLNELFKWVK